MALILAFEQMFPTFLVESLCPLQFLPFQTCRKFLECISKAGHCLLIPSQRTLLFMNQLYEIFQTLLLVVLVLLQICQMPSPCSTFNKFAHLVVVGQMRRNPVLEEESKIDEVFATASLANGLAQRDSAILHATDIVECHAGESKTR